MTAKSNPNPEKIIELCRQGYPLKRISFMLDIPVGHFKQEGTIKRILYIESRRQGGKACMKKHFTPEKRKEYAKTPNNYFRKRAKDKEWHQQLGHKGGTATQKKWGGTERQREWCRKAGHASYKVNKGHWIKLARERPREFYSRLGKLAMKKNPNHCYEMQKKSLKNIGEMVA